MKLLRRLFRRAKPVPVSRPLPCYLRRHFDAQDAGRFSLQPLQTHEDVSIPERGKVDNLTPSQRQSLPAFAAPSLPVNPSL